MREDETKGGATGDDEDATDEESQWLRWRSDVAQAVLGGVITLAIGVSAALLLRTSSHIETRQLMESLGTILPYLASSGIAASASVLALMLTLLSVSRQSDVQLAETFYRRILWIGRQASVLFGGCVLLLLTLGAPLVESDAFGSAQDVLAFQFYATASLTAVIAGISISMIMMLQSTVSDLVMILGFGVEEHRIIKPSQKRAEAED